VSQSFSRVRLLLVVVSLVSVCQAEPQLLDRDGDGVPDELEVRLGFDPDNPASVRSARAGGDGEQWARLQMTGENGGPLSLECASRFLAQASWGGDKADLWRLRTMGIDAWLNEQIQQLKFKPPLRDFNSIDYERPETSYSAGSLVGYVHYLFARHKIDKGRGVLEFSHGEHRDGDVYDLPYWASEDGKPPPESLMTPWMRNVVQGEDQLRQRVAWALSQIFVVSAAGQNFGQQARGLASFYDILLEHSLGSYEELLHEVTLNPMMGEYLTYLWNAKKNGSQYPDENYAREVMQLFSIGLWELELDGSRSLVDGKPVPSYDIEDIKELARVYTGLGLYGRDWDGDRVDHSGWHHEPSLVPTEPYHDPGKKRLPRGEILPAGQLTLDDIRGVTAALAKHPNVAPFLSFRLIQHLVTSNPSKDYVRRVAEVFEDNGDGVRGDLGATVRAILLDPAARGTGHLTDPKWGKLREPIQRLSQLVRVFDAGREFDASGPPIENFEFDWLTDRSPNPTTDFRQGLFRAPSVFSFFQPGHIPAGSVLAEKALYGPEFQILDPLAAVTSVNRLWSSVEPPNPLPAPRDGIWVVDPMLDRDQPGLHPFPVGGRWFQCHLDEIGVDAVSDPEKFLDRLNLLLAHGQMRASTRTQLRRLLAGEFG